MARGYGPKKTGPDLSWADDDLDDPNDRNSRAVSPPSNIPAPTFPPRTHKSVIRTPKPLSTREKAAATAQLQFRQRCREGPLFTVLDKNTLLVDGVSRKSEEAKRRGFNPFEQQERYSTRHLKKARTEPDLGPKGRGDYGYTLTMFPEELWGVLDPEQKLPYWKTIDESSPAFTSLPGRKKEGSGMKKRKNRTLDYDKQDREQILQKATSDDDDEDPIKASRKRQKRAKDKRPVGEKRGMDAEDDVDAEPNAEDGEEEAGEDEPEDSDFSEDSDMNDYDAEQYFDAGEDEDEGGDDHGGGDDY